MPGGRWFKKKIVEHNESDMGSLAENWKNYVKNDFENNLKADDSKTVSGAYFTEEFNDGCTISAGGWPPFINNTDGVTHWIIDGTTSVVVDSDEEYDENENYISGGNYTVSCRQTYEGDVYWKYDSLNTNTKETVENIKAIAAGGISCIPYWHERTYADDA